MKDLLTQHDPYAPVNHPLQPLGLKVHLVAAPYLVFAVGRVFMQHIWRQFRSGLKRGRRSGTGTILTRVPLALSGYLLQTVTAEGWVGWLAMGHLAPGTLFVLGFVSQQGAMWVRQAAARRRTIASRPDPARRPPRAAPPG